MIAVLQRVSGAQVQVNGGVSGAIGKGLLVLVCAKKGDLDDDADRLALKVSRLRIFADDDGRMNRSVVDVRGEVLVVSQFSLAATIRKGNRPSFDAAEAPGRAEALYERFVERLRETGLPVRTGRFGEMMQVSLVNDGPVTIIMDTEEWQRT